MSVSGGIKFFEGIYNLLKDGASVVASSGTARADFILGRNPLTLWKSDTGSDATVETLTITLPVAVTVDRVFLLNHNFKNFTIKYDTNDTGAFSDFTSVIGINGTVYGGGIAETAFAYDTAYYEVAPVSVKRLEIVANTTQVADAKKILGQLILTEEIATLSGYPSAKPSIDRNKRTNKTVGGRTNITRGLDTFDAVIRFQNYPTRDEYITDIETVFALNNRDLPFMMWPCGGRSGATYFKHVPPGWRLRDIALVNITNELTAEFQRNIYINGVDFDMRFEEAA